MPLWAACGVRCEGSLGAYIGVRAPQGPLETYSHSRTRKAKPKAIFKIDTRLEVDAFDLKKKKKKWKKKYFFLKNLKKNV